jgi:ABC-type multidrug transport system fused ATPase/permease subunit
MSLLSYYKHIGYLTQEPSVFDGTIRENLEYGMNNEKCEVLAEGMINNENLESVIALSKCERIYDLPHGLDTEIGERGIRLS